MYLYIVIRKILKKNDFKKLKKKNGVIFLPYLSKYDFFDYSSNKAK